MTPRRAPCAAGWWEKTKALNLSNTTSFILNADFRLQPVHLPAFTNGRAWYRVIDTSLKSGEDFLDFGKEIRINSPDVYLANPRSTVVFVGK